MRDIGRTAAGTDSPTCGESEVPTMVPTLGGGWGRDRSMAWRRPRRRRCASTSAVEEADLEKVRTLASSRHGSLCTPMELYNGLFGGSTGGGQG